MAVSAPVVRGAASAAYNTVRASLAHIDAEPRHGATPAGSRDEAEVLTVADA